MDGTEKIIKKNNVLLILFLTIFLIIAVGIGIYIKIEISNTWFNYNILLNSVLENSRSLYLGLNDGVLQLYSCEENVKQKIKTEMSKYLNTIPSVVYFFPFSFCLSNFNFRDITNNIHYDYLLTDMDIWLSNSLSNFSNILEIIENCMNNALSNALSQESAFLLEPIIVSKKQMWAIHQKMINYSIIIPKEEYEFGQDTLICNNSMTHDLEGSPRITGVLINGSEYQAPLFKIDNKLLDKDFNNFSMSDIDIENVEADEISHDQIIEKIRLMHSSNIKLSEFNLISHESENKEFSKNLSEADYLNQSCANPQERNNSFVNISNPRTLEVLNSVINGSNGSKSAFNRTIYIPTSSLLSIIEVFSEGMKELERNLSNNLQENIMLIQVLSSIMILIFLIFTLLVFVPLVLIENEKGKEIFSNYGLLIVERYQYFSRKYSLEINSSFGEFYSLFERLFNVIHKMVGDKKKEKNKIKEMNKAQILDNAKNIQLNIVYKQLIGIFKFRLCYLWKLSILSSYCLAIISECQCEFSAKVIDLSNRNMNSILETISKLMDENSPMAEIVTEMNSKRLDNHNYLKLFLIYIVICNLVYSINSMVGKNKKIKLTSQKKSILLSISSEEENKSSSNNYLMPSNFLNCFNGSENAKNICECFEEFNIENNWLNILINRLNLEFSIKTNFNEVLIDISNKNNGNETINNSSKNNYLQNQTLENGFAFVLILENLTPYQNYIIEDECSKMEISFIRTKHSNLNFISPINTELLLIFANKISIKLDEIIKFVSEMINDQSIIREIVIFWLENDETVQGLNCENNPNKSSLDSFKLSNSLDKINYCTTESSQNAHYLLNNYDSFHNKHVNNIKKFLKTKIIQYSLREPLSHLSMKKLLSNFDCEKNKSDGQFLPKNSPLQNFIDFIDNNIYLQLSNMNFFANNFIFKLNNLKYNEKYLNCNENNYLSNEFIEINNGILIREFKLSLSIYSTIRPYDWKIDFNEKSVKLDSVNSVSLNRDLDYKALNDQLLLVSESELTSGIRNSIRNILLLSSMDKLTEKIDLLMYFWEFIKRNTLIKNEKLLQYYCPKLVLHCMLVLEILVKNSIGLIENIAFDFNNLLALIISFISIPFIKPGISSDVISFSNEIIPIYSNKLAPLEVQVCSILENILSLPKFSNLFDDFEVS
ncbi:uncharacterized protein ELE39_001917 [Cryptosporidium sp. chipmunk genotype I]|uniref:uncharacterized protein n=1 Tax=Cryptosporidium sp. chipmunk genotype I TaxID=1280935 RepID=UPI00351AA91F|nr:hypothetical protein ELE39_001917 [Cryptosporidium sp. chipmunk genotype I]